MNRLLIRRIRLIFTILVLVSTSYPSYNQFPFRNVANDYGLSDYKKSYGLYVNDFNNDQFEDLLITYSGNSPLLFLNEGGQSFRNVTDEVQINYDGNARTAIWVDINNDGWTDIYIAGKDDPDALLINENGTFYDATEEFGIFKISNTFSVNIAEINQDPFLDIYLSNFLQQNIALENEGEGILKDKVNYHQLWDTGYSMASIFFDYDGDGDDDLYLVHDADQPNILYKRQSDGSFIDVAAESNANISSNGMGVDIADINNDGCLDIYVTNLDDNRLLLNDCEGQFIDISESAGVNDKGMGWGTTFIDYNNDGLVDILACNDTYFSDYPNRLFMNNGDLTFSSVDISEDPEKTGSYGCTCTDFNLDGKMDLAIANLNENDEFQLLENIDNNENNWIGFSLEGTNCNQQAIGTRVELLDTDGILHTDQMTGGNGYASQGSPMIHFGLNQADVDSVRILWPDGMIQTFNSVEANNYYVVVEGESPSLLNPSSSIEQSNNHLDFSIYPNPSTHTIHLEMPKMKRVDNLHYMLSDIYGRVLLKGQVDYHNDVLSITWPGTFNTGAYFLSLNNDTHLGVQQITIINE